MTHVISRAASLMIGRLLPATVLAASAALASTPLAAAEWDIGKYDQCMNWARGQFMIDDSQGALDVYETRVVECCRRSGGVVGPPSEGNAGCGAPPAVAASTPTAPPAEAANPDVTAQPASPSTNSGPKTPPSKSPFTPAPIAPVG